MTACCLCGRFMRRPSRPVWVFAPDLTTQGQAHVTCWRRTLDQWDAGTPTTYAEEVARFWEFLRREPFPRGDVAELDARMLAFTDAPPGPSEPERDRQIEIWRQGTRQMTDTEESAARAAYDRLLERYNAALLARAEGGTA